MPHFLLKGRRQINLRRRGADFQHADELYTYIFPKSLPHNVADEAQHILSLEPSARSQRAEQIPMRLQPQSLPDEHIQGIA